MDISEEKLKILKEAQDKYGPLIDSIKKDLEYFNKNYFIATEGIVKSMALVVEDARKIPDMLERINEESLRAFNSIRPALDIYKDLAAELRGKADFWSSWIEKDKKVFIEQSKFWHEFSKKYEIAEKKSIKTLNKYKWFISPSLPMDFVFRVMKIGFKTGRQDAAINKLFIDFFEANNWKNLEVMIKGWKNIPLFQKRYNIVLDCLKILKTSGNKKINFVNIVLPTLITQIDGFLSDYLELKNISRSCSYNDRIDKNGKIIKFGKKSQIRNNLQVVVKSNLDDVALDIFLNILFQKAQAGKPLDIPFNFNRHKIIHGENVKYGRKDYLIRAFLVLDFIVHLK